MNQCIIKIEEWAPNPNLLIHTYLYRPSHGNVSEDKIV